MISSVWFNSFMHQRDRETVLKFIKDFDAYRGNKLRANSYLEALLLMLSSGLTPEQKKKVLQIHGDDLTTFDANQSRKKLTKHNHFKGWTIDILMVGIELFGEKEAFKCFGYPECARAFKKAHGAQIRGFEAERLLREFLK